MLKLKRKHKRYVVEGIEGDMLFTTHVKLLDISLGGTLLEVDKMLNIGGEYNLKLTDQGRNLRLKAEVVRSMIKKCIRARNGDIIPIYHVGLKFSGVPPEKMDELRDFLRSEKATFDNRLIEIRFRDEAWSTVTCPTEYKIKRITEEGMLIETGEELKILQEFPMAILFSDDRSIGFTGKVASCRRTKRRDVTRYDSWIEFTGLSDETRANIALYIIAL